MRYEDFSVQIEARDDGTGRARVIASPAGEGDGSFRVPVSHAELERIAAHVADGVEHRRRRRRGLAGDGPGGDGPVAPPELRDVGARLFQALFAPGVRSRYDHSLGQIMRQSECGLRLKLHMALDDPATARLHDLPWEYLLRPDDGAFLGLSRSTAIVRYLSLPLPSERPLLPLPLRILAITAAPRDEEALALDDEMDALHAAWRAVPGVEVEHLTDATLDALRQALLEREFHVLHFMGHGGLGADGEGMLCFEDGRGNVRPVSGPDLAQQLRDFKSLRLVVLNACDSARSVAAAPFTGAATALLQAGVPAVLAMQFPITDEAALAFSQMFYRRLAAGDPVDTAVAEGRLAVQRRLPGTLEWGTPALFLRAPDGRLFEPPESASAAISDLTGTAVAVERAPLFAGARLLVGLLGAGALALSLGIGTAVTYQKRWWPWPPAPTPAPRPLPSPSGPASPSPSSPPRPSPRASEAGGLPALVADPSPNNAARRDVGFAVVDDRKGWDAQASSLLAAAWAARDAGLRHVLMTAAFGSRSYFDPLYAGNPSLLGRARLAQQLDALLLARKSTEFSSDPELPNIVTARTTVTAHLIDARTGALLVSAEAADLGQGGLRAHAEKQAFERAADTLVEQLQ